MSRKPRLITVAGERRSIPEWAEHTGIDEWTIRRRIERGWTPRRAVTTPVRIRRSTARASGAVRRVGRAVVGAAERWESDAWRRTRAGGGRGNTHVVARCLALVALLGEYPDGLHPFELVEELGVSRSTLYRDLEALRIAGVLLEQVEDGAVVYWRLGGK